MDDERVRPNVLADDIATILEHFNREAQEAGVGSWKKGSAPDAETLRNIKAAGRVAAAVKRSLQGKKSYRKAVANGFKPKTFRASGFSYCMDCQAPGVAGFVHDGDDTDHDVRTLYILADPGEGF